MNINEAIVIIDDLCGEQGLYSVAWKMVCARLYAEAQKPSHNSAMDEICNTCGYFPCVNRKQFEGTCITHCSQYYKLRQ